MPRLPSGLHYALDPSPLAKIIERSGESASVHLLMQIESLVHIFRCIDVLYFRRKQEPSSRQWVYAEDSAPAPEDLEPYPSGFNLITIRAEYNKWSEVDQVAFVAFLDKPENAEFFGECQRLVNEAKERLLANPSSMPGLMATWWKLGCHPLQEGNTESPPHNS